MNAKLTKLSVARIKPPKSGRLEVWDSTLPAFGLRITSAGARSYVVALRKPGAKHPSRIKVGEANRMALADARERARELMADPGALEAREQAKADDADTTVATVAEEFIRRHVLANRRERSAKDAAAQLRREFVAYHRDQPIRGIGRRDILEALDRVTDRGHAITANRLLANLRKFFGWCMDRDIIAASPVAGIKRPAKERSRDRVLENAEIAAIWSACDAMGYPFGPFVKLLIVTAQRRDEVAHMAWPDIDLDKRLWTLPREIVKSDRAHEVPLSDLALEIIADLPRIGEGWAFPANRVSSANPISGFSKFKVKLDQLSGVENWRLHDLRRSAASGMARLGQPPHLVAALLNHAPAATMGVTAVYNRHRYGDEKRAALDAWGLEVARIIERGGAEVIALRA
jgi:integrase